MSRFPRSLRLRYSGAALAVTSLCLVVAGFAGSSSASSLAKTPKASGSVIGSAASGSSSAAKAAQKIVASLEKPVPFVVPSLGRRPPKGKSVVEITCSLPICANDMGIGVKKLGWTFHEVQFDISKGPQAYAAAWSQALQLKPNYILPVGIFPPVLVSSQIAQAHAQHIDIIGVVGQPTSDFQACVNCATYLGQVGVKVSDVAIAAGATGRSTVSVGDTTNIGTHQTEAGINHEYGRLHLGTPTYFNLSLAKPPAENSAAVINYIQSHPGTNTVINTLADLTVGLPAALKQAGLASKVRYYVSAPQVSDIGFVRSGGEGPAVAIMNDSAWWNGLEQVVQLSVGKPATPNAHTWIAVMTKQNASSMIAAGGSARPEPPHFQAVYLKAWGIH